MERFIENYKLFLESTKETTPELYKECKPSLPEDHEKILDFFIKNWYPYMKEVSNANLDWFEKNQYDPFVFENVSFLTFMQSLSNENKNICWEYIHTLFALSNSIPYTKKKYKTYEPSEDDADEYKKTMESIKETIDSFPEIISNMVTWRKKCKQNDKLGGNVDNVNLDKSDKSDKEEKNEFIDNSSIGKLAKEISNEINMEDLIDVDGNMKGMDNPMKLFQSLMSGDKESGFGKLLHSVTDKLHKKMESGEINQEDLLKDATKMFTSGLGGGGGFGGGGGSNNGMPDMSTMMNMMKNMSGMSDMFGQGSSKKTKSRQVQRRLEKKLKSKK